VSKDALFKEKKESARRTARSHITLEKSSKSYIRCESEPSQAAIHSVPPPTSSQLAMATRQLEGGGQGDLRIDTIR
jgi:hypothetical protein